MHQRAVFIRRLFEGSIKTSLDMCTCIREHYVLERCSNKRKARYLPFLN